MRTKKDYQALKPYLYTDALLAGLDEQIRLFQDAHEDYANWITLDGFSGFPVPCSALKTISWPFMTSRN